MRKRGCSIGALSRGSKIALGVGAVVLAVGAGYLVYRSTKNQGSGYQQQTMMLAPGQRWPLPANAGSDQVYGNIALHGPGAAQPF